MKVKEDPAQDRINNLHFTHDRINDLLTIYILPTIGLKIYLFDLVLIQILKHYNSE